MLDMSGSHRTPPVVMINGDGNEQQDQQQVQQEQGLDKDSAKNSNGDIKGKNSPNSGKNITPNGKNTPSGGKKTPSEKNSQKINNDQNQAEENNANQIAEQEQNVIRIENHNVRSPSKLSEQVKLGVFTFKMIDKNVKIYTFIRLIWMNIL